MPPRAISPRICNRPDGVGMPVGRVRAHPDDGSLRTGVGVPEEDARDRADGGGDRGQDARPSRPRRRFQGRRRPAIAGQAQGVAVQGLLKQAPRAQALGRAGGAFGAAVGAALGVSHGWSSFVGTSGPDPPPSDPQRSLSWAAIPFRECGPEGQYHWTTSRPSDEIDSRLRVGSPSAFGGITLAMSHRRIVASEDPEASSRPSGVNASDRTEFRWPFSA